MGRNILGIIVGAIFAMAVIMVMQIAGTVFFPLPEAIDPSDTKALSQYIMEEASVASLLFVAFGYGVGAFAGGLVAGGIAKTHKFYMALGVGIVLFIMGVVNLINISHPVWFWFVSSAAYLFFALLAGSFYRNRRT